MRAQQDKSSIVELPELGGCMDDGRTYAEAVANAENVKCRNKGSLAVRGEEYHRPSAMRSPTLDGRALPPPYRAAVIA